MRTAPSLIEVMAVPKGRELISRLTWLLWQDHERYKLQLEEAISAYSYFLQFLSLAVQGTFPSTCFPPFNCVVPEYVL